MDCHFAIAYKFGTLVHVCAYMPNSHILELLLHSQTITAIWSHYIHLSAGLSLLCRKQHTWFTVDKSFSIDNEQEFILLLNFRPHYMNQAVFHLPFLPFIIMSDIIKENFQRGIIIWEKLI
jgi:hypothetical protein